MHKKIAVLGGDGIGPEIITEAIKVLKAIEKSTTILSFSSMHKLVRLPLTQLATHFQNKPLRFATQTLQSYLEQ